MHHGDDPACYNANLAAIFPLCDRLFGTYIDPDTVRADLRFGTSEQAPAWRLALGK